MFRKLRFPAAAFFSAGIFVTAPIVTIPVPGGQISIFSVLFAVCYALGAIGLFTQKRKIRSNPLSGLLLFWFFISLISSFFGIYYYYFEVEWYEQVVSYIPKILLYGSFLVIAMSWETMGPLARNFVAGFFYGCIANLAWAVIEGIYFYSTGETLNEIVFSRYLELMPPERQHLTIIREGIIRASGFNYDPAHLGGIVPIILLYSVIKRNAPVFILAIAALAFSASTTALIASILCLLINLKYVKNYRISKLQLAIFLTASVGLMSSDLVQNALENNVIGFFDRVNSNYIVSEEINPRVIYHTHLLDAVANEHIKVITGSGFGVASHGYVGDTSAGRILGFQREPFDPESTYISYLFDVGFIGLTIYLILLIRSIAFYSKVLSLNDVNLIIYCAICGIFFSSFFYHYTLTAYQVIILIIGVTGYRKSVRVDGAGGLVVGPRTVNNLGQYRSRSIASKEIE